MGKGRGGELGLKDACSGCDRLRHARQQQQQQLYIKCDVCSPKPKAKGISMGSANYAVVEPISGKRTRL